MKEIIVATTNQGKVKELALALVGLPVTLVSLAELRESLPEAEETGKTFAANAILKATHYSLLTGKPCLADDSGLEVDALHGAPGVYSARYAGEGASSEECNQKLLHELVGVEVEQRTARFRCVLAYVDPDGTLLTADGTLEGMILNEGCGLGGFGYDPLFYLPAKGKSLAEISSEEKNSVSHRGQAVRNLAQQLMRYYHENRGY
ncbi:MAG: Nucleoside-triphosphatase rdgB [Firmicutes bacterium]|nr:Nucleoside-triphosphatase rdgB [Bacillota bacterium]